MSTTKVTFSITISGRMTKAQAKIIANVAQAVVPTNDVHVYEGEPLDTCHEAAAQLKGSMKSLWQY